MIRSSPMEFQQLVDRTLALDLETTRSGGRIRRIGAVFRGWTFEWNGEGELSAALARLQDFGRGAGYVLGHNLLPVMRPTPPPMPSCSFF